MLKFNRNLSTVRDRVEAYSLKQAKISTWGIEFPFTGNLEKSMTMLI